MKRIGKTRIVESIIPNMENSYWFRDSKLIESYRMANLMNDRIVYGQLSPMVWSGMTICFEL